MTFIGLPLLIIASLLRVSAGEITEGPRNIVVVDGSKATFSCVTDSSQLCWKRNDKTKLLCNHAGCGDHDQRYSMYISPQNHLHVYYFTINSCNSADPGRYYCEECTNQQINKTAYLVVLERMPECHINVSSAVNIDDVIELQCNVNYSGRWSPNFNCVVESYNEEQQQRTITLDFYGPNQQDTGYHSVTYSKLTHISSENNGDVYRCTVDFSLSDKPASYGDVDSKPPTFNFSWVSFPPLNVQYGPSQMQITRHNDDLALKHGEILRCDSDGNPSAVYTWRDATTGRRLHDGHQLTFDLCHHFICGVQCDQNNATLTLQCEATVSGMRWTNSDHINTSFLLDLRSYNQTCVGENEANKAILSVFIVAGSIVTAATLFVVIIIVIRLSYIRRHTLCGACFKSRGHEDGGTVPITTTNFIINPTTRPSRVNQQYEYDDTCREYEEIATINRPAVAHQAATIVAASSVEQQLAAQTTSGQAEYAELQPKKKQPSSTAKKGRNKAVKAIEPAAATYAQITHRPHNNTVPSSRT